MQVESLTLSRYRCYENAELQFSPGVNIICGPNAAGKTNILEAVYYFSSLKPLRPVREKEMIRRGDDIGAMNMVCRSHDRTHRVEATISASGSRRLTSNGVTVRRNADYIGTLTTVIFCPDDLYLVKGAASERRRMIDRAICQLRPGYDSALTAYNGLISQKQKLLKAADEKPELKAMLPAYNQTLAAYGAQIIAVRQSYINRLDRLAAAFCDRLSNGRDRMTAVYQTVSGVSDPGGDRRQIEEELNRHFETRMPAELAAHGCLTGPHRDDLLISVNGTSARMFASQGQTRTAALALKLAEREISHAETGEYPVLLLDDVLSELDPDRQNGVIERAAEGQIVITCCSDAHLPLSGKRFTVSPYHEISASY